VNSVIWTFRIAVFVLPIVAGLIAYKVCRELRDRDGPIPAASGLGVRRRPAGEPIVERSE
jgi:hypothetical protein